MAIQEAFAFDPTNELCQAGAVGVVACVPAESKFIGVFWQMLAGDMMPGSDDSSFEQGEE